MTLKRPSTTGCRVDVVAEPLERARDELARLALAPGRRIDVDELARQPDLRQRIHASSSVRVSVRSSRYFTMTGVASDSPHSLPCADRHRARSRHDHRAFGHDERLARLGADDAAVAAGRRSASIR